MKHEPIVSRKIRKAEKRAAASVDRLERMRASAAESFGLSLDAWMKLPLEVRRRMVLERIAVRSALTRGRRVKRSLPDAEAPPLEAFQHGGYQKAPMGIDKANVAYNLTVTPLRKAEAEGKITKRQLDAGEAFERQHILAYSLGGLRSCIDATVRGGAGDVSAGMAAAMASAKSELRHIESEVGPQTYGRLVDICVMHQAIGRRNAAYLGWVRLILGLDAVADLFRLPRD